VAAEAAIAVGLVAVGVDARGTGIASVGAGVLVATLFAVNVVVSPEFGHVGVVAAGAGTGPAPVAGMFSAGEFSIGAGSIAGGGGGRSGRKSFGGGGRCPGNGAFGGGGGGAPAGGGGGMPFGGGGGCAVAAPASISSTLARRPRDELKRIRSSVHVIAMHAI
jgi:hypothetical protein